MNAIVIAGLLILVAVQPSQNISPRDMLLEGLVMQKESMALDEISKELRQSAKEQNLTLDGKTSEFLIFKNYENVLEMAKFNKRSEVYVELEWWQKITFSSHYPANVIIIPFAISSLIELLPWPKRNEKSTLAGLFFSGLGFMIMVSVFAANFIYPI